MKWYVRSSTEIEQIHITMRLRPIFYEDSEIFSSVEFDAKSHKYNTDINPSRILNGPLSGPGEELQNPVKAEWDHFIEDCKWLVNEVGFTIISTKRSTDSKKSEYIIMFGIDSTPCGSIVYDLRISDHSFPASFPEEAKDEALEYLKVNNVLDGSAAKAGIDFKVEQVLVGSVKNDSWNRAFSRLYIKLKHLRNNVQIRLKSRSGD